MSIEENPQLEFNDNLKKLYPSENEESESLSTAENEDAQEVPQDQVSDEDIIGNKKISFTGMHSCICGCTHFVDIGHNMCKCEHSFYNHKFGKDY